MKDIFKSACLITGLLMLGAAHSAIAGVAVVTSSKSSVNSLDKKQVAKIFLGKTKSFPNGSKATPIDLDSGKTRAKFYSAAVKKTDSQVSAYWARLIFTGKGQPPRKVYDDSEVIGAIAADKSVIGYIDEGSVNSRVKVLLTLP